MECWDWEFFSSVVNSDMFSVSDCGSLFGPVQSFKLYRDDELRIILETTSDSSSTSSMAEKPAGSVYSPDGMVKFAGVGGGQAIASGVVPLWHQQTYSAEYRSGLKTERSLIHSLQWSYSEAPEPSYIIDWIGNLGSFIWPDSEDRVETGEKHRILRSKNRAVSIGCPIHSSGFGSTCVYLSIGGVEFFVGKSHVQAKQDENHGFILYVGAPNEALREKIRDCLSFCLGNYLLFFGDAKFDSEWHPVSFDARSGYALIKESSRLIGIPPSPLGRNYETEISSDLLERIMGSLYNIYDEYDLKNGFWNYWYALAAPVHMQAAHFGAAIESLQNKYRKKTTKFSSAIITDESQWPELYQKLSSFIESASLSADERRLLTNKLKTLNNAPQLVVMQRFFEALGLMLGKLESDAWSNRNRSAHGGPMNANNAVQTIRENKVLRIMLNRILLALGGGADSYYDYYTLGRPTLALAESIPDDRVQS
jgi:hypothetical protein